MAFDLAKAGILPWVIIAYVWSMNNVVQLDTMMEFSSEDIECAIDIAM